MEITALFIDDSVVGGIQTFYVKIFVKRHLFQLVCFGVKRPHIVGIISFGKKIHHVFVPNGVGMALAVGLRSGFERQCFQIYDPNGLGLTASVISPFRVPKSNGLIRGHLSIGRDFARVNLWNIHFFLKTSFQVYFIKFGKSRRITTSSRTKNDALPIGRPALNSVFAGMPRKAFGFTARSRNDVYVGIAGVLRRKRNRVAVGRKMGKRFSPFVSGETSGIASIPAYHPEVIGIDKDDGSVADGGLAQQAGALCKNRGYTTPKTNKEG